VLTGAARGRKLQAAGGRTTGLAPDPRVSVKVAVTLISDPAVAFAFSVAAPPPFTPPAPLSPRERGEKDPESFFFIPPLPRGEEG